MKLDAAAALFQSIGHAGASLGMALALSTLFLFSADVATALDGIDLSEPVEAVADGACSRLVQIKYPFLSCSDGEIGMAEGDDTWHNSRRLPEAGAWTEGDGYWGPSQNDPSVDAM